MRRECREALRLPHEFPSLLNVVDRPVVPAVHTIHVHFAEGKAKIGSQVVLRNL